MKIVLIAIVSVAILAADIFSCHAQSSAIGVSLSGVVIPGANVQDSSPANIYGSVSLGINAGLYYSKYFKPNRFGFKITAEQGAVPWQFGIFAPRAAFGTHTGSGLLGERTKFTGLSYTSFGVSLLHQIPAGQRDIELSVGLSARSYGYQKNDYPEIIYAFNRAKPYDFDDPSAGPPDLHIKVNNLDDIQWTVPFSASYVVRTTARTQFKVGISANIPVTKLQGDLFVMMDDTQYRGHFNPRTGYMGLNLQFERLSRRAAENNPMRRISENDGSGYRKSVYLERHGAGGYGSISFDMRLTKDRNDGLGIRAGLGLGKLYYAELSKKGRDPLKRALSIPVDLNYILGGKRHGLEAGVGATGQIQTQKEGDGEKKVKSVFFPVTIGYRFQPISDGLVARIAFTPTRPRSDFGTPTNYYTYNTAISLGYSFK